MIVFTALLALLCLYQIRFSFAGKGKALADGGMFNDYMSLESTNAVKGVFILIVFLNHAKSYLDAGGWMMKLHNLLYIGIKNPFLFVPVCLAVTVLLCIPFDFALKKLDVVLFNKKA